MRVMGPTLLDYIAGLPGKVTGDFGLCGVGHEKAQKVAESWITYCERVFVNLGSFWR